MPGPAISGRTVVSPDMNAPRGGPPPFSPPPPPPSPPPGGFPAAPPPPADRTVPAPSLSSGRQAPATPPPAPRRPGTPFRPSGGSLVDAVVDAHTMEPPAGMPAVQATVGEDDRTEIDAPRPRPASAGGQVRTAPQPVAIAPVRAAVSPATQPDRPGGFSGGPGHGPLPTVNRAQTSSGGTLGGAQRHANQGEMPHRSNAGPRLVLVARDGSEGEVFPIEGDQMTVGRTHGDLLFPEDPFLSPMHVRLQRTDKGMGIFDAGSTNGVYMRIRGSSPVYPGDQFMIGHQLLRLENIDTQVQERPPAIDGTRVFGTPLQPAWGCVRQVGRGGIVGDKYYLRGSQVVFGREGGDLLFPNDPFVSREHARLRLELRGQAMAVFLEDLESANGSYIRIRGSAEMEHTDTFRIGDQILRLRLH